MTTKGKQKVSTLLQNIKKLPAARQKFWLAKIKTIRAKAQSKELGVEPAKSKVIMLPAQTITGKPAQTQSDWLLDTANWMQGVYDSAVSSIGRINDKASDFQLAYVNELDKVYNGVATEVANVASSSTKAIGTGIGNITGTGDMWPYILGAGVALIGVYYFTQISPIRRFL